MIERTIYKNLQSKLGKGRVIVVYGPRRVGKTTLTRKLLEQIPKNEQLYLNCDELATMDALKPTSLASLERVIGNAKRIVIDEAQRVVNIGLSLKILIDAHPELDIIATGSSSFELANKVKEPLTGRSFEFHLSPLSISEIQNHFGYSNIQMETLYERLMRYGCYPGIVLENEETAEEELKNIADRYVYKDTLELVELRQRQLLPSLLQQLALNIGQETSYHDLGNILGVKLETIERYITLLESAFIIHRLPALTGKQGSLSNRKRKVYFYDLGIRNALIQSLQPMSMRADREALWENFCVNERLKLQQASGRVPERYYWRGINGGKVDLVEKENDKWSAYGFNWEESKKLTTPKYFAETYQDAEIKPIHRQSLLPWIS